MGLRKSTWGLIALAALGEVATVAIALIMWGTIDLKVALVTLGVGELIVIAAIVGLVIRGKRWLTSSSKESTLH